MIYWTILHRKIHSQWCLLHLRFVGRVLVLVKVVAHTVVANVFVYLDLSLYLLFCLLHGSYVASLGVLRVLLLLGGFLSS